MVRPLSPFALALLLVAAGACAPDRVVDGRPYSLKVPNSAVDGEPLPLVLLLHGYSVNGAMQDFVFPFSGQVDEKRFLYALPNGTPDSDNKRFWNATDGCCQPEGQEVDDVAFLRAVIEDVKGQHAVDASRVFLVGHSNGGFMALRMACEASDLVAAVVSVAGAAWSDFSRCGAGRPVSVLALHGTSDGTIHYEGGETDYGPYPSAPATAARFAARNGCGVDATAEAAFDLEGDDGEETTPLLYPSCPRAGAVELWTMEGVRHLPRFNDGFAPTVVDWLMAHPR